MTGHARSREHDAEEAFTALSNALDIVAPGCRDDGRFTLDPHELQREELGFLSVRVCWPCPVRDLCRAYAEAARPAAGVWAGRVYGPRRLSEG
ncbi:WhiB family transcriptional regulator [Microbacterium sp. NPDC087589]|uniref:WhiB family transcriptional regulator n=1 Tax=Microbacterium sp. NPDC087589 TaxID=3364191 RepID=UPI00382A59EB